MLSRVLAPEHCGLGKARGPMLINLIAYGAIGLPIGYTLYFKTPLGIYGLWNGLTLALIFAAALALTMWLKQSRWLDRPS
jgi:MATE family multidrug resistance protein